MPTTVPPRDPQQASDVPKPALTGDARSRALDALRNIVRPAAQLPAAAPLQKAQPGLRHADQERPAVPLRQPEPELWAPPGRIADAAATATAIKSAQPSVRATGVLNAATLDNYLEDPAEVQRDIAAALAGQRPRPRPQNDADLAVARQNGTAPALDVWRPTVPRDTNALVVINQALANPLPITPDWHDVKNLPGYQAGGLLRRIIRKTFEQAQDSQLEQLHMICDLLNPPAHVQAVARWIANNATPVDGIDYDYARSFPGFTAQFKVFRDQKTTYIVTQDLGGHYVYICPGGLTNATAIDHDAAPNGRPAAPRRIALGGPGD